jgi:hypothetical protein
LGVWFLGIAGWARGDGSGVGLGVAGELEPLQLVEGAFAGALAGVDAALEAFEMTVAERESVGTLSRSELFA